MNTNTPKEIIDNRKNLLIEDIVETFSNPTNWPLSDQERIACMKRWFTAAHEIRLLEPHLTQPHETNH